ncbi:MAG: O-antigen ligase family protein [Candidatus Sumerlaeia bacterium]
MGRFAKFTNSIFPFLHRRGSLILLVLFWGIVALAPFGKGQLSNLRDLALAFILIGFLAQIASPLHQGRLRFRLIALAVLWLIFSGLAALSVARVHDEFLFRQSLEPPLLFCISLFLLLVSIDYMKSRNFSRHALLPAYLFAAIAILFFFSALLSPLAHVSLRFLYREGGLYIPIAQILYLELLKKPDIRKWLRPFVYVGLAMSVLTIIIFFIGLFGDFETRIWLEQKEWIRFDYLGDFDRPWRVQFPFEHHNRMASFNLLICFITLGWFAQRLHKGKGFFWTWLALLPAMAILVSKTRGAYVALVAGLFCIVIALLLDRIQTRRQKHTPKAKPAKPLRKALLLWGIPLVLLLSFLSIPGPRHQVKSILNPRTYIEKRGSLGLRFAAWQAGWDLTCDNPIWGVGYGSEVFERIYETRYMDMLDDPEKKPHAHNNYLEIAAESGIPVLLVFLGLNAFVLLGLWNRRKQFHAYPNIALIGLLGAIHAYGMVNYSLRQSIGLLIWGLLAIMAAQAIDHPEKESEDKAHGL